MVNDKLDINIPSDWTVKYLDDFGNIVSGGTPSTSVSTYWNGLISWCTPTDITGTEGNTISQTEKTITEEGLKNSAAVILPAGSLLLCTRATIGDSKINNIPMATNQGFKNVIPFKETCIKYLYYLLQTKKREMLEKATASTFAEISKSALCEIALQAPKKSEQEKIAEALSAIDDLIYSLKRLVKKYENIRRAYLEGLFPDSDGNKPALAFINRGEYTRTKFGKLCSVVTKQTGFDYTAVIKDSLVTEPGNSTLPYLQTKNFSGTTFNYNTDHYIPISVADDFPKINLKEKCLLFSIVGASVGNIGFFPGIKDCFLSGAICVAKLIDKSDAEYLFYYMLSNHGQHQIEKCTKGGAQATITIEDIRNFDIILPERRERLQIGEMMSILDNAISKVEEKLSKYQKIKQGMMEELLTGKVRLI